MYSVHVLTKQNFEIASAMEESQSPYRVSKSLLLMPDWSLLPEELLQIISKNIQDCFDIVHARSVCRVWRSNFAFPSYLLRPSYTLPSFTDFPFESKELCTLEKIPVFLFRPRTPPAMSSSYEYYYLGDDIGRDKDDDRIELPSPIQCAVKVNIPGSNSTLMNIRDCQIIPMGHQYRMIGWNPASLSTKYRGVAFLPLNNDDRQFLVLLIYNKILMVFKSSEMRWMWMDNPLTSMYDALFTFRGKFYVAFFNGDIFVIDPYSLERVPLMTPQDLRSDKYLVPYGNDELFLVETVLPLINDVLCFPQLACRVSRLDVEAGKWVVINDLGDFVLFIGELGNCAYSAKDIPDGCGLSGNSLLFTNGPGNITNAFKYGVPPDYPEAELSFWRFYREHRVTILNESPPVVVLQVDRVDI